MLNCCIFSLGRHKLRSTFSCSGQKPSQNALIKQRIIINSSSNIPIPTHIFSNIQYIQLLNNSITLNNSNSHILKYLKQKEKAEIELELDAQLQPSEGDAFDPCYYCPSVYNP